MNLSKIRTRSNILDKPLSRGKGEVSLSCYAFLFSEIVQYCHNRVHTIPELQGRLTEMGKHVGIRLVDLFFVRERDCRREVKVLTIILLMKSTFWLSLFGREADKVEHATDDDTVYFITEKEPLVNKFISIPKDKGSLNCAVFIAGIMEGFLTGCGFPAKVTTHWHNGTTYMIQFEESVIARDKQLEEN
ncbi:trafficking protein particle complex subunit 5-like [Schistocerca nitens]|uniref:trafficking protein particle complex subunit 5-like n=1 Tax=Schistocerca cancellata TaxID=274614 RepID=UPI0021195105|nr:trafficking protein particle complex subunit 5-like [Schistocerca cancellata]XP_049783584.1 trafficking protein particle complex subunit 5-like [Schistocerca cancellata]XP_049807269.1 trafficking protein particle complex subunit 5-like [Schistocerca nitens]